MRESKKRRSKREGKRERERERERDRWHPGKVLAFSISVDVNSCSSALMSADLHNGVGNTETEAICSFAIPAGNPNWTSLFA